MLRFIETIQYNQTGSSQAVGIGSYGNRTPQTSTHAAQLHSRLSQKHNTFCEGPNRSGLKSFHFGAYESELVMADLSGLVVTQGGATMFCLKVILLELSFLPAWPAAALPGSSRHGFKHWPRPSLETHIASVLRLKKDVLFSWPAAFIRVLTWCFNDGSRYVLDWNGVQTSAPWPSTRSCCVGDREGITSIYVPKQWQTWKSLTCSSRQEVPEATEHLSLSANLVAEDAGSEHQPLMFSSSRTQLKQRGYEGRFIFKYQRFTTGCKSHTCK